MLAKRNRLRRSADFSAVLRHGQRAGRGSVVLHLAPPADVSLNAQAAGVAMIDSLDTGSGLPVTRFGLIVGRGVGNSVVRHQVSRRLRGVLAGRVNRFPAGSDVVVRARPAAATARSGELADDLDGALATVLSRASRPAATAGSRR